MTFSSLLHRWRTDPLTAPNITAWQVQAARPADWHELPSDVPPRLAARLRDAGIRALYSHQAEAWHAARRGAHVVVATGTASGKTLCYNLPVLAMLEENPSACALYLFPTKALAQDQLAGLRDRFSAPAAIYDGDTPPAQRPAIRREARILLSNPDMLHTGILPHHARWANFFRQLRFVVMDELHTYRGVFGAHVANVLRRLRRVAAFYGARPQFILTSATIANPRELAENLVEAPVTLIEQDGSARGERHFLLYNPPVVDEALGLRKSALREAARLAADLLATGTQAIVFVRSRRSVELLLSHLNGARGAKPSQSHPARRSSVRGYRSGYLPAERREIERGLRDGSVRLAVATNALELGVDIGGMGAVLMAGYPGTVASVRQQAGRAGRGDLPSAAVLIASPAPLDQFLAHHPAYLLERSPEQALLNPDHWFILLQHVRCALFELPFRAGQGFGRVPPEVVREYLDFLVVSGEAHRSGETTYWMHASYPAASVSLRSASSETVVLHVEGEGRSRVIGEVDVASAPWMVHPRAVYLHEGQPYLVRELNLKEGRAALVPAALDYFTEPLRETTLRVLSVSEQVGPKGWGEVRVTEQVTGFRKRAWSDGASLGQETLDLPPMELQTTACWLSIPAGVVEALQREGLWTNAPNDYGPDWPRIRRQVRARDGFRCQMCGRPENGRPHDVHHKIPFRMFRGPEGTIRREEANRLENLVTLCPECHRKAETNVRVRSGLAGLGYALSRLAPLFLMCDPADLGLHIEPVENPVFGAPAVALYDHAPGGIGFSQALFALQEELLRRAFELVSACPCEQGCPSCVGPGGENGMGGKAETLAVLRALSGAGHW